MDEMLDLDLDDIDMNVSELRDVDALVERLRSNRRLRIKRRSETIGVLIDADAWRALQRRFRELEAELEARDDEALAAIAYDRLADRSEPVLAGSEASAAAVRDGYNALMAQRRATKHSSG
jgi:hypothetical protein